MDPNFYGSCPRSKANGLLRPPTWERLCPEWAQKNSLYRPQMMVIGKTFYGYICGYSHSSNPINSWIHYVFSDDLNATLGARSKITLNSFVLEVTNYV